MPSAGRSDSWIILSGSLGHRISGAPAAAGSDDSLSEFASETPPHAIVAPGASTTSRGRVKFVTVSARHNQVSTVDLDTATRSQTGPRTFKRRAFGLVASLATRVHGAVTRSTAASTVSLWIGHVRNLRRPATSTTLSSFTGGIAIGVLVMWFVGAQPPPIVAPSPTHAVTPETLAPAALRALSQDVQPVAEGMSVSTIPRPVDTNRPRVGDLHQAVPPSRAASALSARRRNAAGAPSSSYRGSLAFRSAPQGARVFVNGAFVGSTPLVLKNLPVGSRAVRIEADGYQRWSASTQVVANRQTSVSATLGHALP